MLFLTSLSIFEVRLEVVVLYCVAQQLYAGASFPAITYPFFGNKIHFLGGNNMRFAFSSIPKSSMCVYFLLLFVVTAVCTVSLWLSVQY